MSLIVETGAGITGANAYVSIVNCTAYHAERGNTAWTDVGDDDLYSAAIIRATMALDANHGDRWPGKRILAAQTLDWPRWGAWDRDGLPLTLVPLGVYNATCEAALVELVTPGALSKSFEQGLKTLGIGSISKSWDSSSSAGIMAYPSIRNPLSRIIKGGGQITIGGR